MGDAGDAHPPHLDASATDLARAIDDALGAACPATMRFVVLPADRRESAVAIAERCLQGVTPSVFSVGLVELVSIDSTHDGAEAATLRALAHENFALGVNAEGAIRKYDVTSTDRSVRSVAYAIVVHLARRPGVGAAGVLRVARAIGRLGLDAALELPPVHTDVETLFALARADGLEAPLVRGPMVTSIRLREPGGPADTPLIVVELDRPVRAAPIEARICGVPTTGVLFGEAHDMLHFAAPKCPTVDGAPIYTVEIGGLAGSPRGLDGGIVAHTYGRLGARLAPNDELPVEPDDGAN